MPETRSRSGGLSLHFDVEGEGDDAIVLVHGFASNARDNWQQTGWTRALAGAGHRVVALDCRGHGASDKPHDPAAYAPGLMAEDVLAVMQHADAERPHLMGYSMGASLSLELLARHPERFRTAVIAGIGDGVLGRGLRDSGAIAAALLAPDAGSIEDPVGRAFRAFAEQGSNDLEALAACMRRERKPIDREALAAVQIPVLVVLGDQDVLAGPAEKLVSSFPNARLEVVPGDHLSAVAEPRFREVVLDFLAQAKADGKRARA
jgi:pimeloyl-ACP methyl ester carboxylesterase